MGTPYLAGIVRENPVVHLLSRTKVPSVSFVTERRAKPELVFDVVEFDRAIESLKLETKEAKAAFLGVPRPTFSKIANGKARPNAHFVAAVWHKLPTAVGRCFRAEVR